VARNEITVGVPPEAVFEVLSDARCYGKWVVGSSEIRAADPEWPASGTAFDHRVGVGPMKTDDCTEVLASRAPSYLELLAHARPLPAARVTIHLTPENGGTRVTMLEDVDSPTLRKVLWPLVQPATWMRNHESLRRLRALAEGRAPRPSGALPPRR
jgi:uncharacterized protein YndB with AHSA1/START domain